MKRIFASAMVLLLILTITGCMNRTIVNESLYGEGNNWSVEYTVRSRIYERSDKYGNIRYSIFGKSEFEVMYIGDVGDLAKTRSWSFVVCADGKPVRGSTKTLTRAIETPPQSRSKSSFPSQNMLLAIINDQAIVTTFEWDGDNSGEEVICLTIVD